MLSIIPVLAGAMLVVQTPEAPEAGGHTEQEAPITAAYISEGLCAAVFQVGKQYSYAVLKDFHALEVTQQKGDSWKSRLPDNTIVILCPRSTPVPAPFDYRLPMHGIDFHIVLLPRLEREFAATLSRDGDHFTYEVEKGELTDGEQAKLRDRLEWFERSAAEDMTTENNTDQ